jgi:hypothetical protein
VFQRKNVEEAGPAVDQPNRLRTPPGVGPPLQAVGRPGQRHPPGMLPNPFPKETLWRLIERGGTSKLGLDLCRVIKWSVGSNDPAGLFLL